MQRSAGAASRRFYAAFYQWTVRAAAVHSGTGSAAARRCVGATIGARRRQSTGFVSHVGVGQSRNTLPGHAKGFVGSTELLREEAIQSTTDRPADSLEAWDYAVREKSETSVTVEIAVPRWITRDKDIAKRAEVHEVKLSTPFLREDAASDDDLCSVLLTGDFSDVRAVWKHIYTTGFPKALDEPFTTTANEPLLASHSPELIDLHHSPAPKHHPGLTRFIEKEFSLPEPFWQPIGKKGTVQYFQTQHGVHAQLSEASGGLLYMRLRGSERQVREVNQFLERIRSWALEDTHGKMIRNASAKKLDAEIVSQSTLRSDSLAVWQSVTRRLLEGKIEEEMCLPELVWQVLAKGRGVENFRARFAIELLPGKVAESGEKRCIVLKGDAARLGRAKSWLEGFRVRAPMLLEDKEYLRIYEAATGLRVDVVREAEPEVKEATGENETAPKLPHKSYKRIALDATNEPPTISQPTHDRSAAHAAETRTLDRTERLTLPEHLHQTSPISLQETLHQIQTSSGLARFDCLPLSASTRYLRMTGPIKARNGAKRLLNQSITIHNNRSGSFNKNVQQLALAKDDLPPPTHVAWIRLPRGMKPLGKFEVQALKARTDTRFPKGLDRLDWGCGAVRVKGSEDGVKLCIEELRGVVERQREEMGKSIEDLEVLKMGLAEDMPAAKAEMDFLHPEMASTTANSGSSTIAELVKRPSVAQPSVQTPEEQAKQAAPSSLSGYSYRSPALDSPQQGSDAKKAEEQGAHQTNEQLSDNIRSALRHITQPVALVTSFARKNNEPDKTKRARGITVSSFSTVTLHPVPVVSFNIRVPSRSWDAISESGHLRVHLLKATPEGAAAAHAFTLPYDLPHEPFEHLSRPGVHATMFHKSLKPAMSPRIRWKEAIHADAVAKLLPEKCIQVGDHMIVVAEVVDVNLSTDHVASGAGALAYGMKGYRQLGSEIKPMELKPAEKEVVAVKPAELNMVAEKKETPVENETLSDSIGDVNSLFERFEAEPEAEEDVDSMTPAVSSPDVAGPSSPAEFVLSQSAIEALIERKVTEALKQQANNSGAAKAPAVPEIEISPAEITPSEETSAPKSIEDLGPSSPMLEDEALRQVLGESETEYAANSLPSQAAAENPMLAEALGAVAGAYNHTAAPAAGSDSKVTLEAQLPVFDEKRTNTPEEAATSDSKPTPAAPTPTTTQTSNTATHEANPNSAPSTANRPWGVESPSTPSIRKIESWGTIPNKRHYSTSTSTPPPTTPKISKKTLETTVADYLCAVPTHRKRYAALVETQRGAERIEAVLQDASQRETFSPEQIDSLENKALTARRKVARSLALRNVEDLAAMMDKGRVDMVRAQVLESQLEAGQAVVLAEARRLRGELEAGRLGVEEFESAKEGLTGDYDVIEGQLRRLRDFVDDDGVEEEEEGDGEGAVEVDERSDSDDGLGEEVRRETDGGDKL
jgi:flavin reductase (DIM6/NTAB) family NADH-FMN oxidoreductase RutF